MRNISSYLATRYGGKKSSLITERHRLMAFLGRYRSYTNNDNELAKITRLVFVCKGNICRSPFGEYYARSQGLESVSFGLDATTGTPANEVGLEIAASLGVPMSAHKATSYQDFSIRDNDLLVGFEPIHCHEILKLVPSDCLAQVSLAGMWLFPPLPYIHDPYENPIDYFANCYQHIRNIVSQMSPKLPNCRGKS